MAARAPPTATAAGGWVPATGTAAGGWVPAAGGWSSWAANLERFDPPL